MSFCEKCGNELNIDAVFCSKCGAPVAAATDARNTAPAQTPTCRSRKHPGLFTALKNYSDFDGRARRSEYGLFIILQLIILMVVLAPPLFLFGLGTDAAPKWCLKNGYFNTELIWLIFTWVYAIIQLALLTPGLAVTVRRLHDIGLRGTWAFLLIVPAASVLIFAEPSSHLSLWFRGGGVGLLILLIQLLALFVIPSQPRDNEYGPYLP